MTKEAPSKSLKDQNRWPLWLTLAVNAVVFYAIGQADLIASAGLPGLLTKATNILPVSLACIVTSVANGMLSANMKARLVFLRWHYALPGHRAFSKLAATDPRIDEARLRKAMGNKVPADRESENRIWYRFYKDVETTPAVQYVHREFLFTRDYAGFAVLFIIVFGPASFYMVDSWRIAAIYSALLVLQFVIVRHAAATYGSRFVCTVLATKASKPNSRPKPS